MMDVVEKKEDLLLNFEKQAQSCEENPKNDAKTDKIPFQRSASTKPKITRELTADLLHIPFKPENIFEYEWPEKSGDRYFLQELVAGFLGIKSFKRKYPDLSRRSVEIAERTHLMHEWKLADILSDYQMQSLSAIRALEIHQLMSHDYPVLYSIKTDVKKMEEIRKKAIRNASEFNSDLIRDKARERRCFWDLQTSVIQVPSNRYRKIVGRNAGNDPYPIALIPGQYQQYTKRWKLWIRVVVDYHFVSFTPEELRSFPLNSVINYEKRLPIRKPTSPPPITVDELEIDRNRIKEEGEMGNKCQEWTMGDRCSFCRKDVNRGDEFVKCAQCHSNCHPNCMEMSSEMFRTVKAYDWLCMDCKPCSVCKKLDQEDKILFCDRCDRGYHTFCLGLDTLPSGRWICTNFCGEFTGNSNVDKQEIRCRDCRVLLNKDNRVHHRSKFRHSGLCSDCVSIRSV